MTRRRFRSEVERAQAIAHIGDALFSMHSDGGYNAPDDLRLLLEARLRGYLRDDHTGCETCDAELDLERALDAAVQPKPKARVTPLRRTTT